MSRASRDSGSRIDPQIVHDAGVEVTAEHVPLSVNALQEQRRPVGDLQRGSAMAECRWCNRAFQPRRGGSAGRFCCARHRTLFWTACRKWAERAMSLGLLSVADLKADPAACTLLRAGISPAPVPKEGEGAAALLDDLNDFLITILDALTVEELNELPDPVSALLDRIFDYYDRE
jgi:hypothetical protein